MAFWDGSPQDAGGGGGFDTARITRSAWFDGSADYLTRTMGTPNDQSKWIWSGWVRRQNYGANTVLFQGGTSAFSDAGQIRFNASDQLGLVNGSASINLTTSRRFLDSAWYHIVVSYDSDDGTADDRIRIWTNGVEETSFSGRSNPGLAAVTRINQASQSHQVGALLVGPAQQFAGSMAQVCFLDGVSVQNGDYAITDFGESIAVGTNGSVWAPIARGTLVTAANAVGGNSFVLESDIGDGTDDSSNANNFTPTSMSDAANGTGDTPSDPALRMNTRAPNYYSALGTLSKGGKVMTGTDTTYRAAALCHLPMTGRWYAEVKNIPSGGQVFFGVRRSGETWDSQPGVCANDAGILDNGAGTRGSVRNNSVTNSYTAGANDILQLFYDADTNELWLGVNNTWLGGGEPDTNTTPTYTLDAGIYQLVLGSGSNGSGQVEVMDEAEWTYTVPTSGKCPRQTQRPAPTVQGVDTQQVLLWTGDGVAIGSGGKSITGAGFGPDLFISKGRSTASNWRFTNKLRGTGKAIECDAASSELSESEGVSSFDADGVTFGSSGGYNTSTATYAGLLAKLNGTGGSNADGSITVTASVAAGGHMSLIEYTGTGVNATLGHGLAGAPEAGFIKGMAGGHNWRFFETLKNPGTHEMFLDLDFAQSTGATTWNNTAPTASVVHIGTHTSVNTNTQDYIGWFLRNVPGLSFIGAYTGNGSENGPRIPMGFRPRWLFIKNLDAAASWSVHDTAREPENPTDTPFWMDLPSVEGSATTREVDILADGIKIQCTGGAYNTGGQEYIVVALADVAPGAALPPIPGR